MLTPLLRFVDDVPPHMWGVPGVRQNKRRPGFRVPINALPLLGENGPRVYGGRCWNVCSHSRTSILGSVDS